MNPADKMAAFQPTSDQHKPVEDLHNLVLGIDHSERRAIYDRLLSIEKKVKRRGSRGFARYLVAICIGVAATLAWQSYGETTKQIVATRAPELGWSPETKHMIASLVQQLGWTKPPAVLESTAVRSVTETPQAAPVAQAMPENVTPKAPSAPSIDPEQVHQMALDLAALRQTVEQLAAGQEQMAREITGLQTSDQEILAKTPAPPPQPPGRKPTPLALPSSRAPIAPPTSRAPIHD